MILFYYFVSIIFYVLLISFLLNCFWCFFVLRKFLKFDLFVNGASLLGFGFCFVSMSGDLEFPWSARRIAFVYAVVSGFYILFSDRIILFLVDDPGFLSSVQTFKGVLFVLFSALLIYFLV